MLSDDHHDLAEALNDVFGDINLGEMEEGFRVAVNTMLDVIASKDAIFDRQKFEQIVYQER